MTRGEWAGKITPPPLWKIAAVGPGGEKKKRGERKGEREGEKEKKGKGRKKKRNSEREENGEKIVN